MTRVYLDAARDQPCIRCGAQDGTVVSAHYSGLYAYQLGKGMGKKCHDAATAHLCAKCHVYLDSYADGNTVERSQEFLMLCMRTLIRNLERGIGP
ncbi:MAG: hypothetical protein ACYCVY_13420 [Acidiferrobacteraceae bacterium]